MKIATYNVNGVNGRLPVLLRWLEEAAPDIACLQELKAPQEKFPEGPIRDLGYDVIWHGQKSWNGVAILSRVGKIHETRRGLPGDPDDGHSRYIEAAERWLDDALFAPEARAAYATLLRQGWTDALRARHPGEKIYTFWDYFRNAFGRNAGLRIDHLLLSPSLKKRLTDAQVDVEVRGWEKSSDHAPVWIELSQKAPPRVRSRPDDDSAPVSVRAWLLANDEPSRHIAAGPTGLVRLKCLRPNRGSIQQRTASHHPTCSTTSVPA